MLGGHYKRWCAGLMALEKNLRQGVIFKKPGTASPTMSFLRCIEMHRDQVMTVLGLK